MSTCMIGVGCPVQSNIELRHEIQLPFPVSVDCPMSPNKRLQAAAIAAYCYALAGPMQAYNQSDSAAPLPQHDEV